MQEGAEYVRLVFGTAGGAATEVDDPSAVVDAEYLFLAGEARFLGFGDARGRTLAGHSPLLCGN